MITEHEKWDEFFKKLEEAYKDGRIEWKDGWFVLVPPKSESMTTKTDNSTKRSHDSLPRTKIEGDE